MHSQTNSNVNDQRVQYPDAVAIELRQQQRKQEILEWLANNAASTLRDRWGQ